MITYYVQLKDGTTATHKAANIKEARAWAKKTHGIRNPDAVKRPTRYKLCPNCDSKPCCC